MSESSLQLLYLVLNFCIIFLSAVITKCLLFALDFVGWGFDQSILTVGILSIIIYNIICTLVECFFNSRFRYGGDDGEE